MNKIRITKKELLRTHKIVISLGNFDFKTPIQPDFYWAGIYGWYCDIYNFGTLAITYGYNPIGKKPKKLDKILAEYKIKYGQLICESITLSDYWEYFYNEFLEKLKAGL